MMPASFWLPVGRGIFAIESVIGEVIYTGFAPTGAGSHRQSIEVGQRIRLVWMPKHIFRQPGCFPASRSQI